MKGEKLCHLHETFQQEWRRDFPKGPSPALKGIEDILQNQFIEESEFLGLISAVRERLVIIDDTVANYRELLHREIVIKQFLIRILEIIDSGEDLSAQLSTVSSQLSMLNNWNYCPLEALIAKEDLNTEFLEKTSQYKLAYSEFSKLTSNIVDSTPRYRSNTLPKLCYSSSKRNYTSNKDDDNKNDRSNVSNNIDESKEYDEMFTRKKNVKSNGAKDNFLAVRSKHVTPSAISRNPDGNTNKSPQLTRNFQLLKLTDGFDLVLGDSSSEVSHNRGYASSEKCVTSSEYSLDNLQNPHTQTTTDIVSGDSSKVTHQDEAQQNITTIQIRKPRLKNVEITIDSKSDDTVSEVTLAKQTFVSESSFVVCEPATSGNNNIDGANNIYSLQRDYNLGDRQSFQNSLRTFSNKGSLAPPPVPKKPAKTSSSSSKLPVESQEAFPDSHSSGDNSGIVVDSQRNLSLLDVTSTSCQLLNSSYSLGKSDSGDNNVLNKRFSVFIDTFKLPTSNTDNELLINPDLYQKGVFVQSGKNFYEIDENESITHFRHNYLSDSSSIAAESVGSSVVTNVGDVTGEAGINTKTEMSFYKFCSNETDNSEKRNSIVDLVEGVGYNLLNAHTNNVGSSSGKKDESKRSQFYVDESRQSQLSEDESRQSQLYEDELRRSQLYEDESRSQFYKDESRQSQLNEHESSRSQLYEDESRRSQFYEDESRQSQLYEDESKRSQFYVDESRQSQLYEDKSRQSQFYVSADIPQVNQDNESGVTYDETQDDVDKKVKDCHIFVTASSTEPDREHFELPHDIKEGVDTPENTYQFDTATDSVEHSPEFSKRLSSTSSFENLTINRILTTTSRRHYYSVSDDDELDEISASPVAESPYIKQEDYSTGSKDSGLCDDISASETSHTESHIDSDIASKEDLIAALQVNNCVEDYTDTPYHEISYLDDIINEGATQTTHVPERHHPVLKLEEDVSESLPADTFSVPSDGDEEASVNMDSSCDETDSARDGMLKMRQLLVKGVLESEKGYLATLSLLIHYKRTLEASSMSSQPVISKEDIQTIFSNIETVNTIHKEFVSSLAAKVVHWTDGEEIGEIFTIMISKLINFGNYLNNYQQAVATIHKCCQESEQFDQIAKHITVNSTMKEVTSLEDALFKPVQRVQRNTLVIHDLIKYTPEDHPDHHTLQEALKLSHRIIENFATLIPPSINTQENRRLVKSSFLVEDVGGVRKLRYIFLFSDVLVCTKRETRRNNKISFDIKWFAPLSHSSIDTRFSYSDAHKSSTKDDISELKSKLKALKRELKAEMRKSDDKDRHRSLVSLGGGLSRNIEKIKKKINQIVRGTTDLGIPKLPFKVRIEGGKSYTLLMSTDYEREEWKETIVSLCKKSPRTDQSTNHMSSIYIQELINCVKETPQVNKIGNVLLKKDEDMLTGILNVTIHKVNGLSTACDTYCNMEMDSFGHFFFKARTTICEKTQDPAWNEDFDLELEGSETLRILCFKKETGGHGDTLLGRGALELSRQWLKGSFQEKTLSMNEISLVLSMRHIPADKTMQRTPSRTSSAVFGVSISSCAKRESKTVPMIVTACVQEVEKRGMDEVGIYRVSGVSSDLQSIKRIFDKNVRAGVSVLQDADIHSVTGVLKLYFRELPEPLFTEASYQSFIDTLKLSDEEAKTRCMLALLHTLPDTNYYTAVYLLEHLIKVSKEVGINKMSINNLSTIFGPTLLAPASKQDSSNPLEMMSKGAQAVMQQATIINYLLGLAFSGFSLRRSA